MSDLADVIVVPAATSADVLPITSELTYSLLQSTTATLTHVSPSVLTIHSGTATTDVTAAPILSPAATPPPAALPQPEPPLSAPSPPKNPKHDDAVFLTPLPVTVAKSPTRVVKNNPIPNPPPNAPRPSEPNQLIKALLAQKSPMPYLHRPPAPRPTGFIIRASHQSASGKTQILNLPVSVSSSGTLVRNAAQVPVRPPLKQNIIIKDLRPRADGRSAFVRTSIPQFVARSPAPAPVTTRLITAVTTPSTIPFAYMISSIGSTGIRAIATPSPRLKPYVLASNSNKKPSPNYISKTYIAAPHLLTTEGYLFTPGKPGFKRVHNIVSTRILPPSPSQPTTITMLTPRAPVIPRPIKQARTRVTSCHRVLERGEIPQVRKIPPRTFPGPRTVLNRLPGVVQLRATGPGSQVKMAKHATHHVESQAILRGLQSNHDSTRAMQHARSLATLQAASRAQLEASEYEPSTAEETLQAKIAELQAAAQTQTPIPSTQFQVASLGPLQTVTLAQPQGTLNVQLLTAAQAQLLATSKAQLQLTSQAQLKAASQTQLKLASQVQTKATSQPQLKAVSKAHFKPAFQAQFQTMPQAQAKGTCQSQLKALQLKHASQLNASTRAQLITTSQAQTNASQAHILTISQPKLNASSQAQTNASQAHILTISQPKLNASSQAQTNASQAHILTISQPKLNASSQAQTNASQAHILTISQPKLNASSQAQTNTSQAHILAISQPKLNASSQVQLKPSQVQLIVSNAPKATTQAPVQPSARTHHRLVIRSAAPRAPVAERTVAIPDTPQTSADTAVPTQNDPASSQPGSDAGSSIHTTSTLTLATGTTLIMPHYKTTVFKNLSTIARAETPRMVTPVTTSAGERVVIRRPVAYFSPRRTFPTQPSTTSGPVNLQRHVIRTIPRHVLGSHLQSTLQGPQTAASSRPSYVISTSSSEPGLATLPPKPQNADKK